MSSYQSIFIIHDLLYIGVIKVNQICLPCFKVICMVLINPFLSIFFIKALILSLYLVFLLHIYLLQMSVQKLQHIPLRFSSEVVCNGTA